MRASPRREQVLTLHNEGHRPSEIARALGLRTSSVSAHLSREGVGRSKAQLIAERLARQPDRFWSKVDRSSPDVCWPWAGYRTPLDYGKVSFDMGDGRKATLANRAAWFLANGPIPDGFVVRHTCDNPPCVNPAHLVLGTRRDNTHDAIERRRFRSGDRAPNAKITIEQAAEIKRLAGEGRLSQQEIATRFGVHQVKVSQIHTGKIWRTALADHQCLRGKAAAR